ncbi:PorT family protein [Mucilaginibacter achroorhodeus]|uniref:PorT family protein n=1 Tax=Mucilaginibacter achroorhodeus TaxID=2599294 RepID=A0A563TYU9_9SPHI|nr:porin family protein [Mucilaginibacter achroorhodeus]TWR23922.1 PorT family protein [Mucilaginibacter achroorhodeus]
MKKLLFIALCLFMAGEVSAQYYPQPRRRVVRRMPPPQRYERRQVYNDYMRPSIGVAVGANFSNTVDSYNADFSTSTIAGWHVGLTSNIPISYSFAFAPELLFSQKGYQAETTDGNFKQRTNYIDIPLLAKFKVVPGFNFLIGPQLTFQTSTKNIYDDGFNRVVENEYDNRGDKSYVAGVIGISVDLNRNVELRGRYNIDLSRNRTDGVSLLPDYRNQVFQLGLGFKFN